MKNASCRVWSSLYSVFSIRRKTIDVNHFTIIRILLVGLCLPQSCLEAQPTFDDGATSINDSTFVDGIIVRDSENGISTTVNIVGDALVGAADLLPPDVTNVSVLAVADNGGHAIANLLGGTLTGQMHGLTNSMLSVSGGNVGVDNFGRSVSAGAGTGTTTVAVSGGSLAGGIDVGSNSTVTLSGGQIGQDLADNSVFA